MKTSLHTLAGAYVVDALDDIERSMFELHLPGCFDCQQEIASLREATALLADAAATTPPPALRASVLAGIKTIRPLAPETGGRDAALTMGSEEEPVASQVPAVEVITEAIPEEQAKVLAFRPRGSRIAKLLVAAAAVVAIAGGVVYQPWQDDSPPTQALSATDRVLNAPDAQKVSMSFKDGSTATVYRSRSEGRAVLLTQGMALPPAGKAFEVWLQDSEGTMVPAGMMKHQPDNKLLLDGNAVKATGVGITVEPEGGSPAPTSEPVALFEFDNKAST